MWRHCETRGFNDDFFLGFLAGFLFLGFLDCFLGPGGGRYDFAGVVGGLVVVLFVVLLVVVVVLLVVLLVVVVVWGVVVEQTSSVFGTLTIFVTLSQTCLGTVLHFCSGTFLQSFSVFC